MFLNMSLTETHSNYILQYDLMRRGIVTEQVTGLMNRFNEFRPFHESIGKKSHQIHNLEFPGEMR